MKSSRQSSYKDLPYTYLERVAEQWTRLTDNTRLETVYVLLQARERPRFRLKEGEREPHPFQDLDLENKDRLRDAGIREDQYELSKPPPSPVSLADSLNDTQFLVLVGEAGSGKTTTLQFLGLTFARAILHDHAPLGLAEIRIPVRLNLPDLPLDNNNFSMEEALLGAVRSLDDDINMTMVRRWRDTGRLLVLLDSLDEVDEDKKEMVRGKLILFQARAPSCRLVIATRPAGYKPLPEPFSDYQLQPLDEDQARHFVICWLSELNKEATTEQGRTLWDIIRRNPSLHRLARTPLTLKMMVEMESEKPGALQRIQDRGELYRRFVKDVAWDRAMLRGAKRSDYEWALVMLESWAWYRNVLGYKTKDDLRQTLEKVRWPREEKGETFSLVVNEDEWIRAEQLLRQQLGLLVAVGEQYSFLHQTWQEYFVAQRLVVAWYNDNNITWRFLRPRLHLPSWREPLHLFVSLLEPKESRKVINMVRRAHSPYERQFRRDIRLSVSLAVAAGGTDLPIKLLADNDIRVRQAAINALAENGPQKDVIAKLLDALHSTNRRVRQASVETLGAMGSEVAKHKDVVDGLLIALRDPDWSVRQAAAEALGAMAAGVAKREEVVKALLVIFRTPDRPVNLATAETVGMVGLEVANPKEVVASLLLDLRDPALLVRQAAAMALGAMGPEVAKYEEVIASLLMTLRDPDSGVSQAAADALITMGPEIAKHKEIVLDFLLVDLRNPNRHVRQTVARILGTMGSEIAKHKEVVTSLLESIQDTDWYVRFAVAEALGTVTSRTESVIVYLLRLLEIQSAWQIRLIAIHALGAMGSGIMKKPYVETILSRMLDDKNIVIQWGAIHALGSIKPETPSVVSKLTNILNGHGIDEWETAEIILMVTIQEGNLFTESLPKRIKDIFRWSLNILLQMMNEDYFSNQQNGISIGLNPRENKSTGQNRRTTALILNLGEKLIRWGWWTLFLGLGYQRLQRVWEGNSVISDATDITDTIMVLDSVTDKMPSRLLAKIGLWGWSQVFQAAGYFIQNELRSEAARTLGAMGSRVAKYPNAVKALQNTLDDGLVLRWKFLLNIIDMDNSSQLQGATIKAINAIGAEAVQQEYVMQRLLAALCSSNWAVYTPASKALAEITDDKTIVLWFPKLRSLAQRVWQRNRKWTSKKKAVNTVFEAWLPTWEAYQAQKQAKKNKLIDPLFPPPPPRWSIWLNKAFLMIIVFILIVVGTISSLLVEPIRDIFIQQLIPELRKIPPIQLFVVAVVGALLALVTPALARYLWRRQR